MNYAFNFSTYYLTDEDYVPGCMRTLDDADDLGAWCVIAEDFNPTEPIYQQVRSLLLDCPFVVFMDEVERFDKEIMHYDPPRSFVNSEALPVAFGKESMLKVLEKWQNGNPNVTLMVRRVYRILGSVYIDYCFNSPVMLDLPTILRLHLIDSFLAEN